MLVTHVGSFFLTRTPPVPSPSPCLSRVALAASFPIGTMLPPPFSLHMSEHPDGLLLLLRHAHSFSLVVELLHAQGVPQKYLPLLIYLPPPAPLVSLLV